MNRIDNLIKEKCPDGVEYKFLYEITIWDKKFNRATKEIQKRTFKSIHISANDLKELIDEQGTVKLLSTGLFDGYTTLEKARDFLMEDEIITIPSGGSANIKYYSGKFVDSGNILGKTIDPKKYDLKYIYYNLKNINQLIESYFRGSGVKHPSMIDILKTKIPCPPIEIQKEIVRILDKFTKLEAELEVELEAEQLARKHQYEFWHANLLENNYERKKLKDVVDIYIGLTYRPKYVEKGIKFISSQNISKDYLDLDNVKYISKNEFDKSTDNAKPQKGDILFVRVGSNLGHPVIFDTDEKVCTFVSVGFVRIKNKSKLLNKYLKYWMGSNLFKEQVIKKTKNTPKANLNTTWMKEFDIAIPPYDEQVKIVSILDKFEKQINYISEELPAEIELRRKQYEYYRNKLLSFEEVDS